MYIYHNLRSNQERSLAGIEPAVLQGLKTIVYIHMYIYIYKLNI
jgi:hypothetical protein